MRTSASGEVPLLTRRSRVTQALGACLLRPSRSPPRAGTGAASWEAVSSRPNQPGSLSDAPKRRRQSPPSQTHSLQSSPASPEDRWSPQDQSLRGGSHLSPAPPAPRHPRTRCLWDTHLSSTYLPHAIWTPHGRGPPSGCASGLQDALLPKSATFDRPLWWRQNPLSPETGTAASSSSQV